MREHFHPLKRRGVEELVTRAPSAHAETEDIAVARRDAARLFRAVYGLALALLMGGAVYFHRRANGPRAV